MDDYFTLLEIHCRRHLGLGEGEVSHAFYIAAYRQTVGFLASNSTFWIDYYGWHHSTQHWEAVLQKYANPLIESISQTYRFKNESEMTAVLRSYGLNAYSWEINHLANFSKPQVHHKSFDPDEFQDASEHGETLEDVKIVEQE